MQRHLFFKTIITAAAILLASSAYAQNADYTPPPMFSGEPPQPPPVPAEPETIESAPQTVPTPSLNERRQQGKKYILPSDAPDLEKTLDDHEKPVTAPPIPVKTPRTTQSPPPVSKKKETAKAQEKFTFPPIPEKKPDVPLRKIVKPSSMMPDTKKQEQSVVNTPAPSPKTKTPDNIIALPAPTSKLPEPIDAIRQQQTQTEAKKVEKPKPKPAPVASSPPPPAPQKSNGVVKGPKTMAAVPAKSVEAEVLFEIEETNKPESVLLAAPLAEKEREILNAPATENMSAIKPATKQAVRSAVPIQLESNGKKLTIPYSSGEIRVTEQAAGQLEAFVSQNDFDNTGGRLEIQAFASPSDEGQSSDRRTSLNRALEIRKHLINQGFEARRINVRALGMQTEQKPVDRVDLYILSDSAL